MSRLVAEEAGSQLKSRAPLQEWGEIAADVPACSVCGQMPVLADRDYRVPGSIATFGVVFEAMCPEVKRDQWDLVRGGHLRTQLTKAIPDAS